MLQRSRLILERTPQYISQLPAPHYNKHSVYFGIFKVGESVGVAGRNHANLISDTWRSGAEEAIHVIVVGSGCGQEEPGNIISNWKCP